MRRALLLAVVASLAGCSLVLDWENVGAEVDAGASGDLDAGVDASSVDAATEADVGRLEELDASEGRDAEPRLDAAEARDAAAPGLDAAGPTPDAAAPGVDAGAGLDASSQPDASPGLDAGCPPGAFCVAGTPHEQSCSDGADNDGDTFTDQYDEDCACNGPSSYPMQVFGLAWTGSSKPMVGCRGNVRWENRDTLCHEGWVACSAQQFLHRRGTKVPLANYWTSENLRSVGTTNSCTVAGRFNSTVSAAACGQPARVCVAGTDPLGNSCADPTGCTLDADSSTTSKFFGGCDTAGSATASTLCCPKVAPLDACQSGTAQDFGNNYLFGCALKGTHENTTQVCSPACVLCSVLDWRDRPTGTTAMIDYWISDFLGQSGSPGNCSALQAPATDCGNTTPIRVCASASSECALSNGSGLVCGYLSPTPGEYLGGCGSGSPAGSLCCCW